MYSNAFKGKLAGTDIVAAFFPILIDGEVRGAICLDLKSDIFSGISKKHSSFKNLYIDVVNQNQSVLYCNDGRNTGKKLKDVLIPAAYEEVAEKFKEGKPFSIRFQPHKTEYISYYTPIEIGENTWWTTVSLAYYEYMRSSYSITKIFIAFIVLTLIILICAVKKLLTRSLEPLGVFSDELKKMAHGQMDVAIVYERGDEIGLMADSLRMMIDNIRRIIENLDYKLKEFSNGNFDITNDEVELY